jgi:DNA modification methylase
MKYTIHGYSQEKRYNQIILGNNLEILQTFQSELVDLIYLDPPFCTQRNFKEFDDRWKWDSESQQSFLLIIEKYPALVDFINSIETTHSKAMKAYITYITQRMIELHRVLKKTGSIYLHCDPTASHYLKQMMDCIFGKKQFMTEIIWAYSWGVRTTKRWNKKHDVILAYTKTQEYTFNATEVLEARKLQEQSKKRLEYAGALIKDHNKRGDSELALPTDVWHIPTINGMSKERTGYPTQKPLELLRRIIKASSNEGDLVLDPFCGCATTCVASQELNRKWIGIDIEAKAVEVSNQRIKQLNLM